MKTSVYLAGKMTGLTYKQMNGWREQAKKRLTSLGFDVINPVEHTSDSDFDSLVQYAENGCPLLEIPANEIIHNNLYHIARSHIILAEFDFEDISIGTIGEIIITSRELKKPVIAWGKNKKLVEHPYIKGHLTAYRLTLDEALDHIKMCYGGGLI